MSHDQLSQRVYERAVLFFKSGVAQDSLVTQDGKVEKPIPIHDPSGNIVSWFIGITIGEKLASFMQIDNDLRLLRYSTFQRVPESLVGCPSAKTWLNPKTLTELATTLAKPDEELAPPVLTYDRSPSRIVWSVEATDKDGKKRTIYVAGEYVYSKRGNDNEF